MKPTREEVKQDLIRRVAEKFDVSKQEATHWANGTVVPEPELSKRVAHFILDIILDHLAQESNTESKATQ